MFRAQPNTVDNSLLNEALDLKDGDSVATWVDSFLRGSGNNIPLADGLRQEKKFWVCPHMIPLDSLTPKCGPGNGYEFPEEKSSWDARVKAIMADGMKAPPLIVEYKNGELLLADGNHRCEALKKRGIKMYWTVVWCNSAKDLAEYTDPQYIK